MRNNFEIFCRVAELQSFTKAANSMFLSQSAVSQHIRYLEDHYQISLLMRGKRQVTLTSEGKILYDYARDILTLYGKIEENLAQKTGLIRGTLSIGASLTVGEYILPLIVGKFKNQFPMVNITFHVGNNQFIVNGIKKGDFDIGFVGEPVDCCGLTTEHFIKDEVVIIASPDHHFTQKHEITMAELCAVKFIIRENGAGTREFIEKNILSDNGFKLSDLKVWGEYGSYESIKRFVQSGMGISIMSKWAVTQEVHSGLLKIVKIKGKKFVRNFMYIYRAEKKESQLPMKFVAFCKEQKLE